MRIEKIESYLNSKNKEDLNKIINEIKPDIEKIEYYSETVFKNYLINNAEEIKKTLSQLKGIFSKLNPIADLSYYKAQEVEERERERYRMNVTKEKKGKFTTTDNEQSKIISRAKALPYKRIANLVNSYRQDCKITITTLQSMLKSEKQEYNSETD